MFREEKRKRECCVFIYVLRSENELHFVYIRTFSDFKNTKVKTTKL